MESNIFWQGRRFLFEASKGLPLGPVKKDADRAGVGCSAACSASVQASEEQVRVLPAKFAFSDPLGQPAGCSYVHR